MLALKCCGEPIQEKRELDMTKTKQDFPFTQSYWMLNQSFETSSALSGSHKTDVVIVGGGYAGLSTAFTLIEAQPDLNVTLIEAQHIGFGASGRNGGHILNVPPHAWWMGNLNNKQVIDNAHLYRNIAEDQTQKILAALAAQNINVEPYPEFVGAVARTRVEEAAAEVLYKAAVAVGVEAEFTRGKEALARTYDFPGNNVRANFHTMTTCMQPFKLAQGLRSLLLKRGVTIFENSPVTDIQSTQGGVTVTTSNGTIEAQKAVLSTNAYSARQKLTLNAPYPKAGMLHTYMMATEKLPKDVLKKIAPADEGIGDASPTFYYGRVHDDRLLFGGTDRKTENTEQDDRHLQSYQNLHTEMLRRFPYLADTKLYAAWGGAIQQTTFETPVTKRADEDSNIILNTAFGGNGGVNQSILSGRLTTALVLEKTDDTDAYHLMSELERTQMPLSILPRFALGFTGTLIKNLF